VVGEAVISILSPHFDDAVLSCGERIQFDRHNGEDVQLVTVFTSVPNVELPLTVFDMNCGFKSPGEAIVTRTQENQRAATVLDCSVVNLGFYDRQYGAANHSTDDLAVALAPFVRAVELCIAPLGINHPDHEHVAIAALESWTPESQFWVYADLPSRVTAPETMQAQLEHLASRGWTLTRLPVWRGDIDWKLAAIRCYSSQLGARLVDWRSCLVPELFWSVTRG